MPEPTYWSEPVTCANCGKAYEFDRVMGYGCLVLVDGRETPSPIRAWCDWACFGLWLVKQLRSV